MSAASVRTPLRIARGLFADLQANKAEFLPGELLWAVDQDRLYVVEHVGNGTVLTPATSGGGSVSATAGVQIADTAPAVAKAGDLWWNSKTAQMFIRYDDGNSQQWVATVAGSSKTRSPIVAAATAPAKPEDNDLWFDTNNIKLYIYYNDGNSRQWVSLT